MYLNPGNEGFATILNGKYVDKTGLIALINQTINTPDNLTCISRPRRFGKSYAAQMLCAYYDHSCDSHELFSKYEISKSSDYQKHLNQYNVIYLDIAGFISSIKRNNGDIRNAAKEIAEAVRKEMIEDYPELNNYANASECILRYVSLTKRKFIFIIDEWDAIIREARNDSKTQSAFLNLLREWFKNGNFTPKVVAAAYMTGILPIKKDGSESAISNFLEYSMLRPGAFAPYTGFTEEDVRECCAESSFRFEKIKAWYDGYKVGDAASIYNPYSVMNALQNEKLGSYWRKTSAAEALITYIDMDIDSLQSDITRLISGETLRIDTSGFENDFEHFKTKDDVLTLMVHLGYLAYDRIPAGYTFDDGVFNEIVWIPNEEVRIEFQKILKRAEHPAIVQLIQQSDQLLADTFAGNSDAVSAAIEHIRSTNYAPTFYNNEQSLRYIIKYAYLSCVDRYLKIEELPTGKGIADVVFIPQRATADPAMIIELKWNQTEAAAIQQIKEKHYPAILNGYCGEVILVGINYDEKTKNHTCKIERISM